MDTGTRTGISYLANDGSDAVTAYRTSIRSIVAALEAKGALASQTVLGSRPAAGTGLRFWKDAGALGDGVLYYDNGSSWEPIGAGAPTDGSAATPSLRTLGSGATQAAAGNHTHALAAITGTTGLVSALFAQKTVDTARTSTTTLADDPHLVLTLAASSTYAIRGVITYRVTGTPKLKMNFRLGSGVTFKSWSAVGISSSGVSSAGTNVGAGNNAVTPNDFITYSGVGNMGSDWPFTHDITVTTGASGTYDFAFQWAQNTSDASPATVTFGSYLLATKIA